MVDRDDFERFAADAKPRLQRALLGVVGVDAVDDAVAEALAYGFEHWARVREMANPVGKREEIAPGDKAQEYTVAFEFQLIDDERHPDAKKDEAHK